MATKFELPHLGESIVEGTVLNWLRQEGDQVGESEPLVEVATDKVTLEAASPDSGVLLRIVVAEGETVEVGTTLAWIGNPGEEVPQESPADAVASNTPDTKSLPPTHTADRPAPTAPPAAKRQDSDLGFISPAVARLSRIHDVDLSRVSGSGRKGRITKQDVESYVSRRDQAPAAPPEPATVETVTTTEDRDTLIPHTQMRRSIAEHMVRSKQTSPHVTTVMEAELGAVMAHRQQHKPKLAQRDVNLTLTAYFIRAVAVALGEHPVVNASWEEEGIRHHKGIHVGVAVALGDAGLLVPVIRNADAVSLSGAAGAVNELSRRARAGRLQPDELQGGTFTITNYGVHGPLFGTPIINQPQSAILGVGLVQKRAVVVDEAIAVRPMVTLTLTFDHRVLHQGQADGFLADVVQSLEGWSEAP
jgi:2-oxoglutarate dehydrogenase E2 component (dihydrolipoamide succinyltransferase)